MFVQIQNYKLVPVLSAELQLVLRELKQRKWGQWELCLNISMYLGPTSISFLYFNLQRVWSVFAPVIREIKQPPTFRSGYLGINFGRCSLPLIA